MSAFVRRCNPTSNEARIMIKVRILTGVAAAGAAAVAIPSVVGCTTSADDAIGEAAESNTESIAGSGSIMLNGWTLHYKSTSGGDEFLRVGEKMKVSFDFRHVVTHFISQDDPAFAQTLIANPSLVKTHAKVTFVKFDESKEEKLVPVAYQPGPSNILYGNSEEFVIPSKAKVLRLEITAEYTKNGVVQKKELLAPMLGGTLRDFVVFGAFLPNKLALFDTMGAERRMRVVEGGGVVRGANLTLSVADWRLDTIVDKSRFDLYYGDRYSGSRFGPMMVPAFGALEYEVEAVVSMDGGANWQTVSLKKVDRPAVFSRNDGFRFALEKELAVPANAGSTMKVAFHVRAYLQVPGYSPGSVSNPRHGPNARILLRDVWDNNGGQDYSLPISGN
jgi:hypothetical protein